MSTFGYIYICFPNASFSYLFCIFDGYALLFVVNFDDGCSCLARRSHGIYIYIYISLKQVLCLVVVFLVLHQGCISCCIRCCITASGCISCCIRGCISAALVAASVHASECIRCYISAASVTASGAASDCISCYINYWYDYFRY